MSDDQKVVIDGQEYALSDLNEEARAQITNLRVADQKIAQLQQEIALVTTARNTYAKVLESHLAK